MFDLIPKKEGLRESEQQAAGGKMGRGEQQGYTQDRDADVDAAAAGREGGVNGDDGDGHADADGDGGGGGVCGSPLLKAMLDNFRDPCLENMLERLDSILTESTSYTKNPAAMRHEVGTVVRNLSTRCLAQPPANPPTTPVLAAV